MLTLGRVVLLVSAAAVAAPAQQPIVTLRTVGAGRPTRIIREVLAAPHELRVALDSPVALPRDSVVPRTVLVLGGDARVGATVRGDVVVVDGDLYLRPGARISGRAVAIGGCVYNSTLAEVQGARECFRDVTYAVSRSPGGYALDYRLLGTPPPAQRFTLPLAYGLRLPEYNRVDGAVLPWGPRISLDTGRIEIDVLATYRSDLGALDPVVAGRALLGRVVWLEGAVQRATWSNDRWIQSDLLNSAAVFVRGRDTRNYYRADRAELRLGRRWEGETLDAGAWVGGRTERAWSARAGGPWSIRGRRDTADGMLRPNPPVERGRLSSVIGGVAGSWAEQQVRVVATADAETAIDAPLDERFTQVTLALTVGFPTFGAQSFALELHSVLTAGDPAPRQRWAYLGGAGSLPTLPLLAQGGDHLLFIESRYVVPFERLRLRVFGPPEVALRHLLGAAGPGRLPTFVQNVGLRLTLRPVRLDVLVDPISHEKELNLGLTLGR